MTDTISWPPCRCSTCYADVHEPCRDSAGRLELTPHADRITAYKTGDPVTPVDKLHAAR